jgi:hypothetical protein
MMAAERNRTYSYKCNVAELECEELPLNATESITVGAVKYAYAGVCAHHQTLYSLFP